MALGFTNLLEEGSTTGGDPVTTSGSVTTVAGNYYLVTVVSSTSPTVSDVALPGTITEGALVSEARGTAFVVSVWGGQCTAGGTGTVTVDFSGSTTGTVIIVDEVTGHDTSAPIAQVSAGANGNSGTAADSLASFADAVNNAGYMAVAWGLNSQPTEEATWTELGAGGHATPTRFGLTAFVVGEDTTPTATHTSDQWAIVSLEVAVDPGGEIVEDVLQTTETDTAHTHTSLKTKAIGQNSETDTAQVVLWNPKIRILGQATETDSVQAVTVGKRKTLGFPGGSGFGFGEVNTAQTITPVVSHVVSVGQTTETDAAQAILWNPKRRLLGQVSTTDTAQALLSPDARLILQATENDLAQPIAVTLEPRFAIVSYALVTVPASAPAVTTISQAVETQTSQVITPERTRTIGQAYEQGPLYPSSATYPSSAIFPNPNSGALEINAAKSVTLGQAQEIDLAFSFEAAITIGQPIETDTAQPIAEVKTKTIGQASETDTAQPVGGLLPRFAIISYALVTTPRGVPITTLGQAVETDEAQPITVDQGVPPEIAAAQLIWLWGDTVSSGVSAVVNQATETELAQPVAKSKVKAIGQVTETDTAQAIADFRSYAVNQATETDLAQSIEVIGGGDTVTVGEATETDTAQAVTWRMVRLVATASEVDFALDVIVSGGANLSPLSCDDLDMIPEGGPFEGFDATYPSSTTYPSSELYPSAGSDPLLEDLIPENEDDLIMVPA